MIELADLICGGAWHLSSFYNAPELDEDPTLVWIRLSFRGLLKIKRPSPHVVLSIDLEAA